MTAEQILLRVVNELMAGRLELREFSITNGVLSQPSMAFGGSRVYTASGETTYEIRVKRKP